MMNKDLFENDLAIKLQVKPQDIAFINKIFEGYDGLGTVTTINAQKGLIVVHVTPETKKEVMEILRNFPKEIHIID
ncbi:MAG: DUF4911 domain-containing protein [Clostridia bacterium]|nr:DUF4911 domain-containing protein [Clostridia bacterium]